MNDGKNDTPYRPRKQTAEDEFEQLRSGLRDSPFFAHIEFDDEVEEDDNRQTVPGYREQTRLESGRVLIHHNREDCSGRCCLHGTSPYSSCRMPRQWRDDRGIIEHVCEHGVGHPCSAGLDYINTGRGPDGEPPLFGFHGCCGEGCCIDTPPPSDYDRLGAEMLRTANNVTALIGVVERLQQRVENQGKSVSNRRAEIQELERRVTWLSWGFLGLAVCLVVGFVITGR